MLKATGRVANRELTRSTTGYNDEICCASAMRNCWPRSRLRSFFSLLSLSLSLSLSLPFSPDSPSTLRLTFRYASVAASPFIHVCLPRFHFRRKCCSGNGSFSAGLSKRRGGCFRRTFLLTSLMSSILMLHRARFARELDYCLKSASLRHLVKSRADLCSRTSTSGNSEPEDRNRYFFQVTFSSCQEDQFSLELKFFKLDSRVRHVFINHSI